MHALDSANVAIKQLDVAIWLTDSELNRPEPRFRGRPGGVTSKGFRGVRARSNTVERCWETFGRSDLTTLVPGPPEAMLKERVAPVTVAA